MIAHETGHIHGGHLLRAREAIRNAQIQSLIALALGMGAAVAARDGGAAVATLGLGSKIVEGTFLKYTRTQEQSADTFALTALDAEHISARGLLEFFQILENQEFLISDRQDPYMRTHPLTQDRIEFVRNFVEHSRYSDAKLPPIYNELHARMRAKLIGFLDAPSHTFSIYKQGDNSIPARYARAIAYHKAASTPKALAEVDSLIAERPKDPYFHELKGQILFEVGRPAEVGHVLREGGRAPAARRAHPHQSRSVAGRAQHAAGRSEGHRQPQRGVAPRCRRSVDLAPARHRLWPARRHGHGLAVAGRERAPDRRFLERARPGGARRAAAAQGLAGLEPRPGHQERDRPPAQRRATARPDRPTTQT